MPKEQWPQDEERMAEIVKQWHGEAGDCRQELVFIGQHIDFPQLRAELDACLLSDEEMAVGMEGWKRWPDPFVEAA